MYIPYALRQHKFVDRRIFIDLLHQVTAFRPLREYAYLGLGGTSLEDHKLMYGELGVTKLVSLDAAEYMVMRQMFNRPVDSIKCHCLTTTDCVRAFWQTMEESGVDRDSPMIVWFDYTSPKQIRSQLEDLQALVGLLHEGDIIRITLNADPRTLGADEEELTTPSAVRRQEAQERCLARLSDKLQNLMPEGIAADDMAEPKLPGVLAKAIQIALAQTVTRRNPRRLRPLCLLRYKDTHQMMTITGILLSDQEWARFLEVSKIDEWDFYSDGWDAIHGISVPELTLRERLLIDQNDNDTFDPEARGMRIEETPETTKQAIAAYRRLYRHYPQFHHVTM